MNSPAPRQGRVDNKMQNVAFGKKFRRHRNFFSFRPFCHEQRPARALCPGAWYDQIVGLATGDAMPDRKSNTADDATSEISRKLRALYDSVQEEGVPDRFLDLLEKLDQAEKAAKTGAAT